jgi:hypothetical protein
MGSWLASLRLAAESVRRTLEAERFVDNDNVRPAV